VDDYRVQVKHHVAPADVAEISDLVDMVASHDRHRPLSEHKWLDLLGGGRPGFTGLLAHEVVDAALVGYGQLSRKHDGWGLELVIHPDHRGGFEHLSSTLLEAAVADAGRQGGGRVRYWAPMPTPQHDSQAAALGFTLERELRQLRVPLPLPDEVQGAAAAVAVRPFVPGADEEAWLVVNNRAFADHPEQGGWDLATLLERESQPWFDPEGFVLCELDGRLAGFCWTKVHREQDVTVGEIYVIGVDPDFHQRGLGRALTVAGLAHLSDAGATVGALYVDASNTPAIALYASLGFTLDHVDRAYRLDVPAA
jgi:mycothiol synthase